MGEEDDQQQRHQQGGRGQPSVRFAPTAAICTMTATSPPHLYSPRSNVPMTIKSALKHSVSSTSSSSAASGSTDSGFSLGSFSSADIEGKKHTTCYSPAGIRPFALSNLALGQIRLLPSLPFKESGNLFSFI